MMSTAILMSGIREQSGGGVLPSDQSAVETGLFAQSFGEKVEASVAMSEKKSLSSMSSEVSELKATTIPKSREGMAVGLSVVKESKVTGESSVAREEGKNNAMGKIVMPLAANTAGLKGSEAAEDVEAAKTKVPEAESATARDQDASNDTEISLTEESVEKTLAPVDGDAVEKQNPIFVGKSIVTGKEYGTSAKNEDDISPKKTAKTENSTVTTRPGHKASERGTKSKAADTKIDTGSAGQITVPVVAQASLSSNARQGAAPETMERSVETATTGGGKSSPGTAISANQSAPPSETVHKDNDVFAKDTMATVSAEVPDQQAAISKPSVEVSESASAVTMSASSTENSKPSLAGTMVHAMAEASGLASEAVPIVSNVLGSGAKLTAGTAGASGVNSQVANGGGDSSPAVLAGSVEGAPHMLIATPTVLEVGIQNGTHGWLKVRAEMTDGGAVNASVSAASTAGQEMLHRELPALTNYLQEEKVAVNAVVVHANASVSPESRFAGGMDAEGRGQTQQHGHQEDGEPRQTVANIASKRSGDEAIYTSLNDVEDGSLPVGTYVGGGSWLNVRA